MRPRRRRRGRCPRPTSRARARRRRPGAPAAWRFAQTGAPSSPTGAHALVHGDAAAHERLGVEVARAEARAAGGGPADREPGDGLAQAAPRVELDRPRREAAGGEHDGVGRQLPHPRRLAHPHAGHAPGGDLDAHRVRAQHEAAPGLGQRRGEGALQAHARARTAAPSGPRRPAPRAGPGGRPTPRPPARARPPPAATTVSPGSMRGRSSSASRRRSAGSSSPRAWTGPATSARPGRADQPTSTARASTRPPGRSARLRFSATSPG